MSESRDRYRGQLVEIIPQHAQDKCVDVSQSKDSKNNLYIHERLGNKNQLFFIFDLDAPMWAIASRQDGVVADVERGSTQDEANLWTHDYVGVVNQHFELLLEQGDSYSIRSVQSGKVWDVERAGTSNLSNIWQISWQDLENQKFALEQHSPYDMPTQGVLEELAAVPELEDYTHVPEEQTEPALVAQTLIPFICVDDHGKSGEWQTDNSPYYLLKKYSFWSRTYYFQHSGGSMHQETETATVGFTSSNSSEVEASVGVQVNADAEWTFREEKTKSISGQISAELSVRRATSHEGDISKEVSTTRIYDERVTEAIYYRTDRFVLENTRGDRVIEWETRDHRTKAATAYPANANFRVGTTRVESHDPE